MRTRLVVLGVLLLMCAAPASADPFVVRSGGFDFDHEGHGFAFVADGFSAGQDFGVFGISFAPEPGCDPCRLGEAYDPSFNVTNTYMGPGSATGGSVSYSDVEFYGDFSVDAVPQVLSQTVELGSQFRTPFTFSLALRGFQAGQLAFSADLIGSGTATRFFDLDEPAGLWWAGENRLSFLIVEPAAATPEPASLLLLATGITGLAARKWRRSER
jgi:hypothetical protein